MPRSRVLTAASIALLGLGCAGGGGSSGQGSAPGSIQLNTETNLQFVATEHQGGGGSALKLLRMEWGRLVDVYDQDAAGLRTRRFADFIIGEDIVSDGVDYLLERNPVTEIETVTILHPFGSPAFLSAFQQLDQNLQTFQVKGINVGQLGPFTGVARNAAMVLVFDDLLHDGGNPGDANYPASVTLENVRLFTGALPSIDNPFEMRVLPDPSHGDVVNGKFHSSRVIIDLAISATEAEIYNLGVNSLGLPAATSSDVPNALLRLPTKVNGAAGQFSILSNLGGNGVSFTGNGPTDNVSPTLDVVRSFRSYGKTSITGDPENGFLKDDSAPRVLGSQAVQITSSAPAALPGQFLIDFTFATTSCSVTPRKGDVLDLSAHLVELVNDSAPPAGGAVSGALVRVLAGDVSTFGPSVGLFKTTFDSSQNHIPECFVRFSPDPLVFPTGGVKTDALLIVDFSEPIEPTSVQAFDTFEVSYAVPPDPNPMFRRVVG